MIVVQYWIQREAKTLPSPCLILISYLVQSLNSPFFPPHTGAKPGQAKRESRIACMRMLKKNQSKIARPLSIRVHTCSRQSVAQYLFQLARWKKKNIFFGVDIVVKNKLISVLSWSVLLSTTTTRNYSFPKHFFVLFLHFERVCKRFWKESLTSASSSFA